MVAFPSLFVIVSFLSVILTSMLCIIHVFKVVEMVAMGGNSPGEAAIEEAVYLLRAVFCS